MLVISLISLSIALLCTFLSLNLQDEVFRVAIRCTAILACLFTLIVAPWELKLTLMAVTILFEKFDRWLSKSSV